MVDVDRGVVIRGATLSSSLLAHGKGTFGLCDYLKKRVITAKILNLALYETERQFTVLAQQIDRFRPTHIGVILHWQ
jgi:hypothetical protein